MNKEVNEASPTKQPPSIEMPIVSAKLSPPLPRIKRRTLIKNLTRETLGNEAIQALIRIFDTKYTLLRLFWVVCLLGCSSLCAYLVLQTFLTYLSYPVFTTTTKVHEIPTAFPKITICNSMFAITEYAYEMIKEINEQVHPDVDIFNQSQISQISFWNQAYHKAIFSIFFFLIMEQLNHLF